MSEVPPGCGPHRKAASSWLSPEFSIEQMFLFVNHLTSNIYSPPGNLVDTNKHILYNLYCSIVY